MAGHISPLSAFFDASSLSQGKEEELPFGPIECLPNELLFHIFEYACGSGEPADIKTFCELRQVSLKWRNVADASILKLFWMQLKIVNYPDLKPLIAETEMTIEQTFSSYSAVGPSMSSPLSLSGSDDQEEVSAQSPAYFAQFHYLSLKFSHIQSPTRKSDIILRPQAYLDIQTESHLSLEKLWTAIQLQYHLAQEQSPVTYEAIRGWLNAPQHAEQINQVTDLDFKHLDLRILPHEINHFPQLVQLNLYHANLFSIPDTIGNLTQLTSLSLYDNQLSFIPDAIGNLTQLTWLSLSSNLLISLPESIGNLTQLTELYLHDNQLSSIPESIGKLTRLIAMTLSGNQLETVPDSLGNLTLLTGLCLNGNKLSSIPNAIRRLPPTTAVMLQDNPLLPE